MTSRYLGDPLLLLTEEGADLEFIDGQPTMDHDISNQILISLYTNTWWANKLLPVDERLESGLEKATLQPITSTSLNAVSAAATRALQPLIKAKVLSELKAQVVNKSSSQIILYLLLKLSSGTIKQLIAANSNRYWQYVLRTVE